MIDGNQVNSNLEFFCLLGETFFGYRGYFGQDSDGLNDCFSEIFSKTKDKELVETGTRIKIKNSEQVRDALQGVFLYIVDSFRNNGIDVELD